MTSNTCSPVKSSSRLDQRH